MMELQLAGLADWQKIHRQDAEFPEEEFLIFEYCGRSPSINVAVDSPEYSKWLSGENNDYCEFKKGYHAHRRYLQHLQWQTDSDSKRWVLKMPFHLLTLDYLFEIYPDAKFIFMHRDPSHVMSSWVGLMKRVRSFVMVKTDDIVVGAQSVELMSRMMQNAVKFRSSRPDLSDRFLDIDYDTLVANVEGTLHQIHKFLQIEDSWTDEYRKRVELYLNENRQRRSQYSGEHRVKLEDFGISLSLLREAFDEYLNCSFIPQGVRQRFYSKLEVTPPAESLLVSREEPSQTFCTSPFVVSPPTRVPSNF